MTPALGCPISQECLFALVKLPLETVISSLTGAVHLIKGKLIGVPDPQGTQGTRGVPLDLNHSASDPLTWWKLCDYLLRYAEVFFLVYACIL